MRAGQEPNKSIEKNTQVIDGASGYIEHPVGMSRVCTIIHFETEEEAQAALFSYVMHTDGQARGRFETGLESFRYLMHQKSHVNPFTLDRAEVEVSSHLPTGVALVVSNFESERGISPVTERWLAQRDFAVSAEGLEKRRAEHRRISEGEDQERIEDLRFEYDRDYDGYHGEGWVSYNDGQQLLAVFTSKEHALGCIQDWLQRTLPSERVLELLSSVNIETSTGDRPRVSIRDAQGTTIILEPYSTDNKEWAVEFKVQHEAARRRLEGWASASDFNQTYYELACSKNPLLGEQLMLPHRMQHYSVPDASFGSEIEYKLRQLVDRIASDVAENPGEIISLSYSFRSEVSHEQVESALRKAGILNPIIHDGGSVEFDLHPPVTLEDAVAHAKHMVWNALLRGAHVCRFITGKGSGKLRSAMQTALQEAFSDDLALHGNFEIVLPEVDAGNWNRGTIIVNLPQRGFPKIAAVW